MASEKKVTIKFGFPVGIVLTLIFVTLKLTNYIDWSWWWILSPIWIPILLVVGILGIILLIAVIMSKWK